MRARTIRFSAIGVLGCFAAACASGSSSPDFSSRLSRIVPASAGLIAGTSPTSDGHSWVLAGRPTVKTLSEVDLSSGKQLAVVPVSASATSVTLSSHGIIGLGLTTGKSGAIDFRSATTGKVLSSAQLIAPVIDVTPGDDGTTFYVLCAKRGRPATVAVVNSVTDNVETTLPATTDAVAIAATPDQRALYVLDSSGNATEISATNGHKIAQFTLSATGIDLAIAPSGKTLYVLGRAATAPSIVVVDLADNSQIGIAPAAADSVAIATADGGNQLDDFVGTSSVGNIQLIKLASV